METPEPSGILAVNEPAFVVAAYAAALLPWSLAYGHDFISGKWKKVWETRRAGIVHFILLALPMPLMVAYVHYQRRLEDYKEMSMGIVAIFVSLFHILRTLWGLYQLEQFRRWAINAHENLVRLKFKIRDPERDRNRSVPSNAYWSVPDDIGKSMPDGFDLGPYAVWSTEDLLVNNTLIDNELVGAHSPPVKLGFLGSGKIISALRYVFCREKDHYSLGEKVTIAKRLLKVLVHPRQPWNTWVRWSVAFLSQRCLELVNETPKVGQSKDMADKGRVIVELCTLQDMLPLSTWRTYGNDVFRPSLDGAFLKSNEFDVEETYHFSLRHGLLDVLVFNHGNGLPFDFPSFHDLADSKFSFYFPSQNTERLISESVASLPRTYFERDDFIGPSHLEFFAIISHGFEWRDDSGRDPCRKLIREVLGLRPNRMYGHVVEVLKNELSRMSSNLPSSIGYLYWETFRCECKNLDKKLDTLGRRLTAALSTMHAAHVNRLDVAESESEKITTAHAQLQDLVSRVKAVGTKVTYAKNQNRIRQLCLEVRALIQIVDDVSAALWKGVRDVRVELNSKNALETQCKLYSRHLRRQKSCPNMSADVVVVSPSRSSSRVSGETSRVRSEVETLPNTHKHEIWRNVGLSLLASQPQKARSRTSELVDSWIALRNGAECVALIKENGGQLVDNIEEARYKKHEKCSEDRLLRRCTNESLQFRGDHMLALGEALMQFCQMHGGPILGRKSQCVPHVCAGLHRLAECRVPLSDVKEFEVGQNVADEIGRLAADRALHAPTALSLLLASKQHTQTQDTQYPEDAQYAPVYLRLHILRLLQDACREKCRENGHTSAWAIMACMLSFPALEYRELCGLCPRVRSRGTGNSCCFTGNPDLESGAVFGKEQRQVALLLEFEPVQAPANILVRIAFEYENDGTSLIGKASLRSSGHLQPGFDWQAWIDEFGRRSRKGRSTGVQREDGTNVMLCTSRVRIGENRIVYRWDGWPGAPVVDFGNEVKKDVGDDEDKCDA